MTSLVDTLRWLVDIPSVTGEEAALRDAIAGRLGSVPTRAVGSSLVAGTPGPGMVVLAGHLDTVPLQGHVGSTADEDRVYGLGATDMKGGLAVMIHLIEDLGPDRLACVFYAGEEGPLERNDLSRVLADAPWLSEAEASVVLEPTDRRMEAGCQGVINAEVRFEGVAAHSARPWLGHNAVSGAGWFLTRIHELEPEPHIVGGLEFREVISITMARGGVAKNIVPAELVLNVNYRFSPERTVDEATARLAGVCEGADGFQVVDAAPAGAVSVDHPLFQALLEVSGAQVAGKQGWTDVAQLSAAGIPAVNFGPGEPELAHKPGESVRVSDLTWAYESLSTVLGG